MPTRLVVGSMQWGKIDFNEKDSMPELGKLVVMRRDKGEKWVVVHHIQFGNMDIWGSQDDGLYSMKDGDLWLEIPLPPKFK